RLGEEVAHPAPGAAASGSAGSGRVVRRRLVPADRLDEAVDGAAGVQDPRDRLIAHGVELVGDEEALLGAEVAVYRGRRDVGRGGDLLDRDGGETALVDQVESPFLDGAHGVAPPLLAKPSHAPEFSK